VNRVVGEERSERLEGAQQWVLCTLPAPCLFLSLRRPFRSKDYFLTYFEEPKKAYTCYISRSH